MDADQQGLRRTYALIELTGDSKMVENWGRRDEIAMIRVFSNLLRFSDYEITREVSGWEVACPECGHVARGRHCESQPRTCKSAKTVGCSLRVGEGFAEKAVITKTEVEHDFSRLAGHDKSSKHRKAEELAAKGQPIHIMGEQGFIAAMELEQLEGR